MVLLLISSELECVLFAGEGEKHFGDLLYLHVVELLCEVLDRILHENGGAGEFKREDDLVWHQHVIVLFQPVNCRLVDSEGLLGKLVILGGDAFSVDVEDGESILGLEVFAQVPDQVVKLLEIDRILDLLIRSQEVSQHVYLCRL